MIEVLVHLELDEADLPLSYTLLRVEIPKDLSISVINAPSEHNWKVNHSLTRSLGDDWLANRLTALARVPSVILPDTFNYLLNPLHPDSTRIQITGITRAEFDPRLLQRLRG
jgi:RES domain-containing protein